MIDTKELRSPSYWMCGSKDGHEGESYLPVLAADEIDTLRVRLEAAEKERDALRNEIACVKEVEFPRKAQAVADAWKEKCNRLEAERDALRDALRHEADCVEAAKAEIVTLRAKIERMEKQEPAWFIDERGEPKRYHKSKADYCKYGGLDLLYALPGAKGE